jgi:acyl-CoA synthetase (NDP forming)
MIITNAGGIGVMAVDNAEKYNIKLTEFNLTDKKILSVNMPSSTSFNNPIDILGDATSNRYQQILNNSLHLKKENFTYLILLTPQTVTDYENIADIIINFSKNNPDKCIITCFIGGETLLKTRKRLKSAGILHFNYPKDALKAYKKVLLQKEWESIPSEFSPEATCFYSEDIKEIKSLLKKESKLCSASIVSKIMKSFNISFIEEILIKNIYDIDKIWDQLNIDRGMQAVMKISSPDIAHKTDIDGVILNIKSKEAAKESFKNIIQNTRIHRPNAEIKGVTLQKMFDKSREVFVGMTRDPIFGELMIFGFGGIYLNVFEDVTRKISPMSPYEIKKMIKEIKYYTILKGTRGEKSINFEKLEDLIFRLSCMFHTLEEIESIDMNPIFCTEKDAYVIDAKIFVKDKNKTLL